MYSHELDLLWRLHEDGEALSTDLYFDHFHNRPRFAGWTRQGIVSSLRSLERRGFVESDGDSPALWRVAERGVELIHA
jgi:hypothetical protein